MNNYQDTFQKMAMKWPSALVARQEIYKITGGLISPRTMANLDSQGKGPRERIVRGGKVAYDIDVLIEWLRENSKVVSP